MRGKAAEAITAQSFKMVSPPSFSSRTPLWLAQYGCQSRHRTTTHRTFTPYFCVNGGTIPFKRRYATSCP
jgi:hypothetical protein